jgi:hypothetical protein|tara:strand:+ start:711 stop:1121 length:411 start_codon:yes stop_codon:yes gene_type:complete
MFEFRIDRTPGALAFTYAQDGLWACITAAFFSPLIRLMPLGVRISFWEQQGVCRESAVEWVAHDTREMMPVLQGLVVSGALWVGGDVGSALARRDFISIVRKAAFKRGFQGNDAAPLHDVLDELKGYYSKERKCQT